MDEIDRLRRAYEAGYERGSDDEAYEARGVGPHTHRPPTFEEWIAAEGVTPSA